MVGKLDIPRGVVVNRWGIGDSGVEEFCLEQGIPVMLTIPLDTQIAYNYSRGVTLVEGMPQWRDRFLELFDKVKETVDARVSSK